MSKLKMADAAVARREARRKRILENSINRLQLISGKSSDESIKVSDPAIKFPVVEVNNESSLSPERSTICYTSPINNGVVSSQQELLGLLSSNQDLVAAAAGDGEITNDFAGLGTPTLGPVKPTSLLDRFITHKYDIVCLSIVIQLFHELSWLTFDNAYFFLPLAIYIVTKFIWAPSNNKSGIANMFLVLNGVSANRAHNIMNTTQAMGTISKDICIYLFTTICIQAICIFLKNNVFT